MINMSEQSGGSQSLLLKIKENWIISSKNYAVEKEMSKNNRGKL